MNIDEKNSNACFTIDVLKLSSGATLAQLLGVLAAPIITRLYGPEAFGIEALFIAISGIIGAIACLRYELAIMLPKTDKEAVNLFGVSIIFTLLISTITLICILLWQQTIIQLLNAPDLAKYIWLIPLFVFINGILLASRYWNSRKSCFGRLSVARIASSSTIITTQIGAGLAGYATAGILIGGNIIGSATSALILCISIWRDQVIHLKENLSIRSMITAVKKYRKFPLFDTWSALLIVVSMQFPQLLLSFFFSTTVVGYYALATRVLNRPMTLIGSAIAQVFFQRAAKIKTESGDKLAELVEDILQILIIIGFFPFLVLSLVGKDIFVVVFGNSWAEAGIYAQILSSAIFFMFITSPISTLFSVLGDLKNFLMFNFIFCLTRFGAILLGSIYADARVALVLFTISEIIVRIVMYSYLLHKIKVSLRLLLNRVSTFVIYSFILLTPILIAKWILIFNIYQISLISATACLIYFLIIVKKQTFVELGGINHIYKRG